MRSSRLHRQLFRGAWLALVLLGVFLALSTNVATAQGFMVKPMRMEVAPVAGRPIDVPLEIHNTAGDAARDIDLRVVELSQDRDGAWGLVEGTGAGSVKSPYSAVPWTTLPQSKISIDPLQPQQVMVHLVIPSDARGTYFAGIVAETPLPPNPQGITIRVRFLIPLIVQIAGRPVRQQVELADVKMDRQEESDGTQATTTSELVVANSGRTLSRVKGQVTVEAKTGPNWRTVTRIALVEKSVLPGFTIELAGDLGRRLPSGHYRLRGDLEVDGRRVPPVSKEIDFVGDPKIDALAYDTALVMTPPAVDMQIVPGATRTTTLTIQNPGTDSVHVSMSAEIPREIAGVEMGAVRGSDLSAESWTQVQPSSFEVAPGRRQNVRVISRLPMDATQYPNYYANLILRGVYGDGQSAGTTSSIIHLANPRMKSSPRAQVEQLEVNETDSPGKFIVQSRLDNVGDVDLSPSGQLVLLTPQGAQIRKVNLSGDEGPLLPLAKRSYSASVDLNGIAPGYYAMKTIFFLASGNDVTKQQIIQIQNSTSAGADGASGPLPSITIDPGVTTFPATVTPGPSTNSEERPDEPPAPTTTTEP